MAINDNMKNNLSQFTGAVPDRMRKDLVSREFGTDTRALSDMYKSYKLATGRDYLKDMGLPVAPRIFITLNGTDAHYTLENPIVEAGVFNHSYDVIVPAAGGYIVADNTPSSGMSRFAIASNGNLLISTDSSDVYNGVAIQDFIDILGDNILHKIGMRRDNSDLITLSIDGGDVDSRTGAGTFTFNSAGAQRGAATAIPFWSDIIANLDLGNGNAWQLNRPFPANTEQSSSGNNLLTYVNIDADARELFTFNQSEQKWVGSIDLPSQLVSAWAAARGASTIGGSTGSISATSSSTAAFGSSTEIDTIIGSNYTVIATVSKNTGPGTMRLRVGEEMELITNVVNVSSASTINAIEDFVATVNPMYLGDLTTGHDAGDIVTISNFSIKRFIPIA